MLRLAAEAFPCGDASPVLARALQEFRRRLRVSQAADMTAVSSSSVSAHTATASATATGLGSGGGGDGDSSSSSSGGGHVHGHLAPVFGFMCLTLGVDVATAARMLLFTTARDVLSAANRLSLIGPMQAARLLSTLSPYVDALVEQQQQQWSAAGGGGKTAAAVALMEAVAQVDPVLELLQASHEQLYSRLFNS
jgi:urease accessory protein